MRSAVPTPILVIEALQRFRLHDAGAMGFTYTQGLEFSSQRACQIGADPPNRAKKAKTHNQCLLRID